MRRLSVLLALGLLSLTCLPPLSHAQVLYGTLVGNVTDSSGAAIPGAQVKITNVETGREWTVQTGPAGTYSISTIPPGTYEVTFSAEGFRTYTKQGVQVAANATVRVDATLEVGIVTESVQVSAEALTLQTDTADVRDELRNELLSNLPIPVTRNYQTLLVTVPGFTPPEDAHSLSANPSRALRMMPMGTNAASVAIRVDGATAGHPWLPHIAGYVPSVEAIEAVNVVTGSYEAEQGFAGGAAVNVQIKSGTNEFHGSLFEYHNNQHLKARPYFLPATRGKEKRILNQYGGTLGGPIVRNKLFFFAAYEGTLDRQSSFRLADIPTMRMRTGDLSRATYPIFDPLTGKPDGSARTPFAGSIIPASRISPVAKKLLELMPQPNLGDPESITQNYFANGPFIYDRHTLDTKFTWNVTDRLLANARISWLNWHFINPPVLGPLGGQGIESRGSYDGKGYGDTLSMTYSGVYTVSPSIVIDGYIGYTLLDNQVENTRLDEKLGLEYLGIPGTNGPTRAYGGWPGFSISGWETIGRAHTNSPWYHHNPQSQYVVNVAWIHGKHNVRFGYDSLRVQMRIEEPAGSPGFFSFATGTTSSPGYRNDDYNSFAAFLLGLANQLQRRTLVGPSKGITWGHALYFRDRWQATRKLTLSMGIRWDYFPVPVRDSKIGFEIYDFNNNTLKLCGYGNLPRNCGFEFSKRYFAPRFGIAYRITETLVVRSGYGITWDPINAVRNGMSSYPYNLTATWPAANSYVWAGRVEDGIPSAPAPDLSPGIIQVPGTVTLEVTDPRFRRSYLQSWNLTFEKELPGGWVGELGYVGNRGLRLQNRWDTNYGYIGGGNASRVLYKKFGRSARTALFGDHGGFRSYYDSLQAVLQKRFTRGYMVRLSYTWSKTIGPVGNANGVDGFQYNTPEYWPLIAHTVRDWDRTHMLTTAFGLDLPFGQGKRWATSGWAAKLLGGWQINGLLTAYTGSPFTVTASDASLNAPGNSQIADQIKPKVKIYGKREQWFDTSAYAPVTEARFGNSGWNQLRGPGLINLDLGVFRRFKLNERVDLQFRAEAFNVSNTPHFANPRSNVSASGFGEITSVQNVGREGIDERMFRFALRLGF